MIPQDEHYTSQDTTLSDIFDLSPREETAPTDNESVEPSEESSQGVAEVEPTPRKPRITGDRSLWFLYFAFLATSLLFIYSATSTLAYRGESLYAPFTGHLKHIIISVIAAWGCSRLNRPTIRYGGILFFIGSLILVVLTLFIGTETNEAKRTFLGIQPSEFYKVGVIFLASAILSIRELNNNQRFYIFCGLTAIGLIFVAKESLSMGIIIITFVLGIGLVQTGFSKSLLLVGGVGAGLIVLLLACLLLLPDSIVMKNSSTARWKGRIEDFTSKSDSSKFVIDEDNFQEQHARIAIARSNGTGVFPGNSVERDILPEAYSDFIYAIIIEETGFIGMIWVPLLYILLFFKLSRWATRSQRNWQRIILLGVGIMYTTQAIIHMCVVTGISPNTGQTLPLISRGGSSLLATSIAIGVCIAITRQIREDEYRQQLEKESKAEEAAAEAVAANTPTEEGSPLTSSEEVNSMA
ncbi:FtsW/RodA/SpoVE family cell cycle protein [uncultured Porphyromonas sp.]|uniref:FtsW/RodA/SpoVE family cell cycle protein n=1 Tax=uncultured Porphyromonas sp. TaxID=159274 RepID=UPI00262FE02A|nr:FtsW/RodA/SpoVE family cell cycle protein [uncultured Porphyromonas sp.]